VDFAGFQIRQEEVEAAPPVYDLTPYKGLSRPALIEALAEADAKLAQKENPL
jgi:hypothetical protein